MDKVTIEYDIAIQSEEQCKKHNDMCKEMFGDKFTPIKPTDEHIETLYDMLADAIQKVGDDGGWYTGDGISVKIEIEYDPENK